MLNLRFSPPHKALRHGLLLLFSLSDRLSDSIAFGAARIHIPGWSADLPKVAERHCTLFGRSSPQQG